MVLRKVGGRKFFKNIFGCFFPAFLPNLTCSRLQVILNPLTVDDAYRCKKKTGQKCSWHLYAQFKKNEIWWIEFTIRIYKWLDSLETCCTKVFWAPDFESDMRFFKFQIQIGGFNMTDEFSKIDQIRSKLVTSEFSRSLITNLKSVFQNGVLNMVKDFLKNYTIYL